MKQKILKSLLILSMVIILPFMASANDAGNEPTLNDENGDDPNNWGSLPTQETTTVEKDESKEIEKEIDDDIDQGDYSSPGTTTLPTNPPVNSVNPTNSIQHGTTATGSSATGAWGDGLAKAGAQGLPDGAISEIVFNLASWLLILLGSFAVIGFVISGILYLTSAGNEDRMETAKKGMIYSIIGVIVGLLGYIIVQAVDTWFRVGSVDF